MKFISTDLFKYLMISLIVANTAVMAGVRYPVSAVETSFEEVANFIFYICFVVEMILKLVGLGPKGYFKDGFNIFDCLIIVISTIDIIFNTIYFNS